jgi:hypothetical protein
MVDERRRIYRDRDRPRCSGLLNLPFPAQCSRLASVERNGRFYCGTHDPKRIPKRKRSNSPKKRGPHKKAGASA